MLRIARVEIMTLWSKTDTLNNIQAVEIGKTTAEKRFPGPETIKKSGAWIGAQLTMLCSINRKLRSGDYKEIGVVFVLSLSFVLKQK